MRKLGVHRYAVATALATLTLLVFGGLVSTTESGLACPDWPLCEGKFIPKMIDGKEYEHTHRLVASFVGVMTFGLCALLFKHRRRDVLLTRLGVLAAIGVTVQALLGALTVKLKLPWWVSSAHLATAMAFFCLVVSLAFLTRQRDADAPRPVTHRGAGRAVAWVTGLTYLQIVVGGLMRHLRGGLACGFDFPLCQGTWWPLDGHLGIQVHMVHRSLGIGVGLAIVGLAVWLWRQQVSPAARGVASAAGVLVGVQVALGIFTVLLSRDLLTMTAHSTVGALLLGLLVSLFWLVRPVQAFAPAVGQRGARSPRSAALETA